MCILRRMMSILLPLIPLVAMGGNSPLIDKVRHATAQYLDINVAISQGFVPATPCVSGLIKARWVCITFCWIASTALC
jgi:hypothetical protein